jgi:K+-sensing histidine kinase KdpD
VATDAFLPDEIAGSAGAVAVFVLCATTAPLSAGAVSRTVLGGLIVAVALVGRSAGRRAGAVVAVAGAFSFDFFHVAPIRVLHGRTLLETTLGLVLLAVAAGTNGRRLDPISGTESVRR